MTGWRKWLRGLFGANPAAIIGMVFFYALFLGPLVLIAWGSFDLLQKLEMNPNIPVDYRMLVLRFLIAVPLATISAFGFASLRLYRKLFEEYNHKQRVMELYQSFNDEIKASGSPERKRALLDIMLKAVSDKAWENATSHAESDHSESVWTRGSSLLSGGEAEKSRWKLASWRQVQQRWPNPRRSVLRNESMHACCLQIIGRFDMMDGGSTNGRLRLLLGRY